MVPVALESIGVSSLAPIEIFAIQVQRSVFKQIP
jgi:hypothetical protein